MIIMMSEESEPSGLTTEADIDKRMKYKEIQSKEKTPKVKVTVRKNRQMEVKIGD